MKSVLIYKDSLTMDDIATLQNNPMQTGEQGQCSKTQYEINGLSVGEEMSIIRGSIEVYRKSWPEKKKIIYFLPITL